MMDDKEFGKKMYHDVSQIVSENYITTVKASQMFIDLTDTNNEMHFALSQSEVRALAQRYYEVYPDELAQVEAVKRLVTKAWKLLKACEQADEEGDLSYYINGEDMCDLRAALAPFEVNDGR